MPGTADRTDAATFAAIDRIIGEFDAARAAGRKKKPRTAAGRPAFRPRAGTVPGAAVGATPDAFPAGALTAVHLR